MAYAAVVSLKHTIHGLLSSSIGSSARELLESACVEVKLLQQVLKKLDDSIRRRSKRLDELDGEIREAVNKLEDSLEFHGFVLVGIDGDLELEQVREEVISFVEKVKKMEDEYIQELDRKQPDEEDDYYHDAECVSSSRDFGVEMVGFLHHFSVIKKKLLEIMRPDDFGVFSIVGRAGSGRTVAARIIFEELCISQEKSLDCGAWVNVGSKYEWKKLLVAILRQLSDPAYSHGRLFSTQPSEEIKVPYIAIAFIRACFLFIAFMFFFLFFLFHVNHRLYKDQWFRLVPSCHTRIGSHTISYMYLLYTIVFLCYTLTVGSLYE